MHFFFLNSPYDAEIREEILRVILYCIITTVYMLDVAI